MSKIAHVLKGTWECLVNIVNQVIKGKLLVAMLITAVFPVNAIITPSYVTSAQEYAITVLITQKAIIVKSAVMDIMGTLHMEQLLIARNVHVLTLMQIISSVHLVPLLLMVYPHVIIVQLAILEDSVNSVMMDTMVSQHLAEAVRSARVAIISTSLLLVTVTQQRGNA
jgi:hypothetical protein